MEALVAATPGRGGADGKPEDGPFLIVSSHDYRTARKVNLHHLAQELSARAATRFFSVGFSALSDLKGDPRAALRSRSNRVETVDGVECYLWRTALHPFNLRIPALDQVATPLFKAYARRLPQIFLQWARESRVILIESGLPALLFEEVKRASQKARIVYFASDDLASIGSGDFLRRELRRTIARYDAIFSPSRRLASTFPSSVPAYCLPYGMDAELICCADPSPFPGGLNAVSAGSTLFDPTFFAIAAPAFPDIAFHVIGGGPRAARLNAANIHLYDEMPVREVLAYFRHAAFGIAPYQSGKVDAYFAESSQKLTQLGCLGVPAVCPQVAAGNCANRFGYTPGDRDSITTAIHGALAAGRSPPQPAPSWAEVTERLLTPERFPDARV